MSSVSHFVAVLCLVAAIGISSAQQNGWFQPNFNGGQTRQSAVNGPDSLPSKVLCTLTVSNIPAITQLLVGADGWVLRRPPRGGPRTARPTDQPSVNTWPVTIN